jgi:2-oxoglutarate dehydrogenase E2 component (dihydrolipoamide succinyltransferase)
MAKLEILMPTMGESIFECTVLKWLVKEGDLVAVDDMILEVATDKIDTEIGSSHAGIITKFFVAEGETALIGKPICEIETNNGVNLPTFIEPKIEVEIVANQIEENFEIINENLKSISTNNTGNFYSPLVLTIAKKENISQEELNNISGSGMDDRVTKDDILAYIDSKLLVNKIVEEKESFIINANDKVIEMDRMRKMIAQRMVESKRIAPHVTSFIETDMSTLFDWRNKQKTLFKTNFNENLTFTPLLIEAVVNAIKAFPGINIQVNDDKIIFKKEINIGMAVALPSGNLIVPVIHKADQLSLKQLTIKVNDLANRARNNQLKPEELMGGTYTITNIGSFGNLSGTPIIVQPQVAIMAFGVIRKMPAVVETQEGDLIGIRQKMIISHSYDHRVVDGSLGGLFLKHVSDFLENFNSEREIT